MQWRVGGGALEIMPARKACEIIERPLNKYPFTTFPEMCKQPMNIDFVFTGSQKFTSDKNIDTRVFVNLCETEIDRSIERACE